MKFSFKKIFFFVIILANPCYSHYFNTLAITGFHELEKFFIDSFLKKSSTYITSSTNSPRARSQLTQPSSPGLQFCQRLLHTTFFQMKHEEYLDILSAEVIEEIRIYYPEIFDKIYEIKNSAGQAYRKKSFYELEPLYAEGVEIMINVCPCLAQDTRTHKIKQYFISEEYSLKGESLMTSSSVRFLFNYDHTRKLIVQGLIEEPAWNTIEDHDIEKAYLSQEMVKKRFKNLLCKLSMSEKLRLCASVMNSIRYRNKIIFRPALYNVNHTCIKRSISFLNNAIADDTHAEWTISCKGKSLETGLPLTYYLSLSSYTVEPVFVLKKMDGKFFLDHYAEFLPVLMDKKDS